ncbi:MAG: Flp family type IVb pilin [Acidobacteria bacterium]|nr:Flp family type IVb pilin [Acidobacteriota bacterium]
MLNRLRSSLTLLHQDESGQGLVEYALVVALLVFAAVATMTNVATDISSVFSKVDSSLKNAIGQ